ncbi:MAG: TIGR02757 family protein [Desulfomonile sp.]|nr:TIGR02757 family protein [Desulfomonile sp.]
MTVVNPGEEPSVTIYHDHLRRLYRMYNCREYVHPDPLEFLFSYPDVKDREIVALVSSSLAYGAVRQILRSVRSVLERLESPHAFLITASEDSLKARFRDFKHRFTTGEELAMMLLGIKQVLKQWGSLESCFCAGLKDEHDTVIPALTGLVRELTAAFPGRPRSLLPSPAAGSACKRHNLFLRWMVRRDAVDPGGWERVPRSKLVVPVDVHMHRLSLRLGLTKRKQADLRTALEVTAAFRIIEPEDPVRYDFCLTRLGIRDDTDLERFVSECRGSCCDVITAGAGPLS